MSRTLLALALMASCQPEAPVDDASAPEAGAPASADAAAQAQLRPHASGYALDLHSHGTALVISPDGLHLDRAGQPGFSLRLQGEVAAEVRLAPCARDAGPGCAPRAELLHDGLTEWWQPRASGIEHGFDVFEPAPQLRLPLQLSGAESLRVGPQDVVFTAEGTRWTYSGLHAFDARGEPLDAHFAEHDGGVVIHVDTANATFPVTVDPLLAHRFWRLRHSAWDGAFGTALSSGFPPDAIPGHPAMLWTNPSFNNGCGEFFGYRGSEVGLLPLMEEGISWFQAIGPFGGCTGSQFGHAATFFDHNASGQDAFVISAPRFDGDRGRLVFWEMPPGSFLFENQTTFVAPANTLHFGEALHRTGDLGGGEGLAVHGMLDGEGVVFIYRFPDDAPVLDEILGGPMQGAELLPVLSRGEVYLDGGPSLLTATRIPFDDVESTVHIPAVAPWSRDEDGWYPHFPLFAAAPPNQLGPEPGPQADDGLPLGGEGPSDGPLPPGPILPPGALPPVIDPSDPEYPTSILGIVAADLDADGVDDAVFSVRTLDGGSYVAAYLSDGQGEPWHYVRSAYAPSSLGTSLARAPFLLDGDTFVPGQPGLWDHTGDGVLAGDPDHDGAAGPDTGRVVLLIYDADADALVPMWTTEGVEGGARLGTEVITNDFNADDELDLFASAPGGTGHSTDPDERGGNIYGWISLRDSDRDGDPDITDCAPFDPTIYNGATEVPGEGVDRNCSGTILCWIDTDNDGYHRDQAESITADSCDIAGYGDLTMPGGDCNDSNPSINPGATEVPGEGIDRNCSGTILCWIDADNDGFHRDETASIEGTSCNVSGYGNTSMPGGDCNDTDPTINPAASDVPGEGIDRNCDGSVLCWVDEDEDGYHADESERRFLMQQPEGQGPAPLGEELPREDLPPEGPSLDVCDAPGYGGPTMPGGDCDDTDPNTNPGATDVPGEGVDRNCDGTILCWVDEDEDGFHSGQTAVRAAGLSCTDPGYGDLSMPDGDCDDTDPSTNPDASDVPGEGIDRNCDGSVLCWVDGDEDGYHAGESERRFLMQQPHGQGPAPLDEELPPEGLPPEDLPPEGPILGACDAPGYGDLTMPGGDCDDTNPSINPGATDVPGDGVDRSCDGQQACWVDADGDGFHAGQTAAIPLDDTCDQPGLGGANTQPGDCDDTEASINPDATDVAGEGIDRSCDGTILCWIDADGDGFHAGQTATLPADQSCDQPGYGDTSTLPGDCDDGDGAINPGATDVPGDGVDRSCSGTLLCWVDDDGDGYHADTTAEIADDGDCTASGYADDATPGGDCDDSDPNINPGATDVPGEGVDRSCAGTLLCWIDDDNDGYHRDDAGRVDAASCAVPGFAANTTPGGDCDDADPAINPGATELPGDGIDQDCDGLEICFEDLDDDGLRVDDLTAPTDDLTCAEPGHAAASEPSGDCDDTNPDADGDRLRDGDEVLIYGTDPCEADSDGDGLSDGDEVLDHRTDPLNPDTDGGGIDDGTEVGRGSDPLDPTDDLATRTWLASGGCATTPYGPGLPLAGLLGFVALGLRRREA